MYPDLERDPVFKAVLDLIVTCVHVSYAMLKCQRIDILKVCSLKMQASLLSSSINDNMLCAFHHLLSPTCRRLACKFYRPCVPYVPYIFVSSNLRKVHGNDLKFGVQLQDDGLHRGCECRHDFYCRCQQRKYTGSRLLKIIRNRLLMCIFHVLLYLINKVFLVLSQHYLSKSCRLLQQL